jgi:A/G-specific adenine glycosylase
MSENINVLIINWYEQNKRDLPWRKTDNPYFIWLSEIILQQTRVQQGLSYYQKFLKNFPTVKALALAEEQEILRNWQGLGYYSRARNLHKAAKIIHFQYLDEFPKSYSEIIKLPGIGDYTAAAIASFAFNEKQAVLDGNVYRVLSRLFNLDIPIDSTEGKKEFRALAQSFLYKFDPASHNQAIMEFGATLCTPRSPKCADCPVRLNCEAYAKGTIDLLPVKAKKTKVRKRKMSYLFLQNEQGIAVNKRMEKDIWQHLYQFPLLDDHCFSEEVIQEEFENLLESPVHDFRLIATKKHLLSHQILSIDFYGATTTKSIKVLQNQIVPLTELDNYPFPRPIVEFLNAFVSTVDK